jgi:AcrR family transcriptional regulator
MPRADERPSEDRRSRRTRVMLRDALVALVLEKGYDAITIGDIVERADLARATFYLHYRDKEDLLGSSLEELSDELVARTRGSMVQGTFPPDPPYSLVAFQHAYENADLYRVMLGGQGVGVIVQRVREHLAAHIEGAIRQLVPLSGLPHRETAIPPKVLANYLVGALLGLIGWWLENDLPYSPEEMARMYQAVSVKGIIAALKIEPPGG